MFTQCLDGCLQDEQGQILEAFSVSAWAGLSGIGPEHSHFNAIQRAPLMSTQSDEEALEAFGCLVLKGLFLLQSLVRYCLRS